MTVLLSLEHPCTSILNIIHLGIFLGTILGGFIVPDKYISFYLLWLPFLFLDWQDVDRQCCFSSIVKQMQSGKPSNDISRGVVPETLEKLGFTVDDQKVDLFLVGFTYINWLYAFVRIVKIYNIRVFPNLTTVLFIVLCVGIWIYSNANIIRYNYKQDREKNRSNQLMTKENNEAIFSGAEHFTQKYPLYY